jgi:hypothetical protein
MTKDLPDTAKMSSASTQCDLFWIYAYRFLKQRDCKNYCGERRKQWRAECSLDKRGSHG